MHKPKQIHIRPMSRKSGSCSTAGPVTLDTGLLTQPADFRKQVIVHALLHLRVPNHGKFFKALLRAYLGTRAITF
jgi:hypothetical protein